LSVIIGGGGQERGIRSGTMDARGAAAFAAALTEAVAEDADGLEGLVAELDGFVFGRPEATIRTPAEDHLPGLRYFTVDGALGEAMGYLLDSQGFDVSAGAACSAGVTQSSHVLEAMGLDQAAASSGLRVSVGHATSPEDIERLVAALPDVIDRARQASAVRVGRRS
jgi:cysteine desulfurase